MNSIKMFATCVIVGVLSVAANPAGADVQHNGGKINGISVNGISVNGGKLNGLPRNGHSLQSVNPESSTSTSALTNDGILRVQARGGRLVIQKEQK